MVDVAKHEDGEVGGDGARLIVVVDNVAQGILELCEDVGFKDEGDDGLGDGRAEEGPGPPGVGYVHSALSTGNGWELGGEAFAMVVAACLGLVGRGLGGMVEVAVQWLASEEGCASLVMRNFGGRRSRYTAGSGGSSGLADDARRCLVLGAVCCWLFGWGCRAETCVRQVAVRYEAASGRLPGATPKRAGGATQRLGRGKGVSETGDALAGCSAARRIWNACGRGRQRAW